MRADLRGSWRRLLALAVGVGLAGAGILPSAIAATAGNAPTVASVVSPAIAPTRPVLFPGNDTKAHDITWDANSVKVDGKRLVVYSGEFHYWRLPSPDQWRDVLQKMKASGFNAVSLYFFWGYHSSKPGQYDFSGVRDIDRLLTMAEQEGLYVIARPGPYSITRTVTGCWRRRSVFESNTSARKDPSGGRVAWA